MSGKARYGTKQHWRTELPTLDELAAWERPEVRTPEDILIERDEAEHLYRAMETLPARYERVLRLHNGINCTPMLFTEIAEQFEISKGRAAQIEQTSCWRMIRPLIAKFKHRPGAQRIRRAWDAEAKEAARQAALWAAERAEDAMRAEAERHNAMLDEAIRREQAEARRQSEQVRGEILRRAELVELELDKIPRRRREGNGFGFSTEKAAEYAEVLRALMLPHYRMGSVFDGR